MLSVRLALALGVAVSTAAGCGLLFSKPDGSVQDQQRPTDVMVEVESHNWNDITVYLLAGGLPQRLGMVTAMGEATFDFPSHRLYTSAGVRLRALPVAGRAFTSETILVLPGQVISWTLENNLNASSYSVY